MLFSNRYKMIKLELIRKKYYVRIKVYCCVFRGIIYLLFLLCVCVIEEFKVYYSLIE